MGDERIRCTVTHKHKLYVLKSRHQNKIKSHHNFLPIYLITLSYDTNWNSCEYKMFVLDDRFHIFIYGKEKQIHHN